MTNTIHNVPRELLERAAYTLELAYEVDTPTVRDIRALLSAPSPAGVDGLKRYEVFPYLDDDVAEMDICESDDGSFAKYDAAKAIIDGLRGELIEERAKVAQLEEGIPRIMEASYQFRQQRDQQAQRIGELEGLLRAESARVDFLDAHIVTADAPNTGKVAMLADSCTLRECIDAALSAGKEGE